MRGRLAGVDRLLERLVDVLPLDDQPRIGRGSAKSSRSASRTIWSPSSSSRSISRSVASLADLAQPVEAPASCSAARTSTLHCAAAAPDRLDPVEVEELGGVVHEVDRVVDGGGERVDVLAVDRRHVLRVQEPDQLPRQPIAFVLELLELVLADGGWIAEASLDALRRASVFAPAWAKRS